MAIPFRRLRIRARDRISGAPGRYAMRPDVVGGERLPRSPKSSPLWRNARDTPPMMQAHQTTAESMLGWKYAPLGRGPDGIDCLGVVLAFYAAAMGIPLPDPASGTAAEVLEHNFAAEFNAVENDAYRDGDVARFSKDGHEHLGIVLGRAVLHAYIRGGVIVTPIARLRPAGYYRHRSFGPC